MFVNAYLVFYFGLFFVTIFARKDYCSDLYRELCDGRGLHIGCQYSDPGPGINCENPTLVDFTENVQYYITYYINRRRQSIAAGNEKLRGGALSPKSSVMMYVKWDPELAFLAQTLANQCIFKHDECRATDRYPFAGQSVGEARFHFNRRRGTRGEEAIIFKNIERILDAWWGEKVRVDPEQLLAPFKIVNKGPVWGHFSQLAVWSLRYVGCGAVIHGGDRPKLLLVCDFSHTNMLGQSTLKNGSVEECPDGTSRRINTVFPLLCMPADLSPTELNRIKLLMDEDDVLEHWTTNNFVKRRYNNEDYKLLDDNPHRKENIEMRRARLLQSMRLNPKSDEETPKHVRDKPKTSRRERVNSFSDPIKFESANGNFNIQLRELMPIRKRPFSSQVTQNLLLKHRKLKNEEEVLAPPKNKVNKKMGSRLKNGTNVMTPRPLKHSPTPRSPPPPKRTTKHSRFLDMHLDDDDIKQLFVDTGFKFKWMDETDL